MRLVFPSSVHVTFLPFDMFSNTLRGMRLSKFSWLPPGCILGSRTLPLGGLVCLYRGLSPQIYALLYPALRGRLSPQVIISGLVSPPLKRAKQGISRTSERPSEVPMDQKQPGASNGSPSSETRCSLIEPVQVSDSSHRSKSCSGGTSITVATVRGQRTMTPNLPVVGIWDHALPRAGRNVDIWKGLIQVANLIPSVVPEKSASKFRTATDQFMKFRAIFGLEGKAEPEDYITFMIYRSCPPISAPLPEELGKRPVIHPSTAASYVASIRAWHVANRVTDASSHPTVMDFARRIGAYQKREKSAKVPILFYKVAELWEQYGSSDDEKDRLMAAVSVFGFFLRLSREGAKNVRFIRGRTGAS